MTSFYTNQVRVSEEEAKKIEADTRLQSESDEWKSERRTRITASKVHAIAAMRRTTRQAGKVKQLLYTTFGGNKATQYGQVMERRTSVQYVQLQQQQHPELTIQPSGLVIAPDHPWLGASPDSLVYDPTVTNPHGLAEYKNPYTTKGMTMD